MSSVASCLEDVGDVVLGDDPEEVVVVVDDRDREQVPLGQEVGGGLAVGGGPDADGRRGDQRR